MAYRSDLLDVRGVRTHLLRGGRGKPVLVLHPEFGASMWAPYHDALAAHFSVLAPDHLGFGKSERPEWLDSIDDLVFHYVDLLDQLKIERLPIIGTSLGGWIAAAFAVAQPARVERLVLAAPAGIKVEGVPRYDYFATPFESTLLHLFHDPSRAAQILPTEYGPEVIVRTYHELTTLARLTWNPYLYDRKLQQRLSRIDAPTLLVWGENDTVLPLPHGDAFAALLPHGRLATLPACGHLVPLECSAAFAKLAIDFLTSPEPAGPSQTEPADIER
jgi:pimeloyl-ACP methyl ester carboxylesterase